MNSEHRYSGMGTINHWIAALLVIVMMVLGLLAYFAPSDEVEDFVMDVHIALGFFVFLFIAWRVAFRLYEGFPPSAELTNIERWIAYLVHRILLLVITLLVVTGPLYLFTEGEGINVFGWFSVYLQLDFLEFLHEPAEWIHVNLGLYVLPAILILHFVGALRHYLYRRQNMPADL